MKVNINHEKWSTNISGSQFKVGRFYNYIYLMSNYTFLRVVPGIIKVEEKLNISRRALHRGKSKSPVAHIHFNKRSDNPGENRNMNRFLPHHAFFLLALFRFKLRFYEYDPPGMREELFYCAIYLQDRYEGEVGAYKIYPVVEIGFYKAPRIPPLHDNHTAVISQAIVKLAVANIHRVDDIRPGLEHAVCKSSGGSSQINGILILQADRKVL
jgi:hypothetical protein